MPFEIVDLPRERLAELVIPVTTAFGFAASPERVARTARLLELDVRLAALDEGEVVGAAGAYTFAMTVPGGRTVETAGLSLVGVLPTHRRRGILRILMRRALDGARDAGKPVSALFASESQIYGRFGYGLGSLSGDIELERDRAAFAHPAPPAGRLRLVSEDQAAAAFPAIWERVRRTTPGMLSRTEAWWSVRRLSDPEAFRGGRGPLQRVLLELDGRPAGYALYRFTGSLGGLTFALPLEVSEAIGDSPEAVRAVWRYLLDIDFVSTVKAALLPVDHALFFLLAEPRRLRMRLSDALWVRLVDVQVALAARAWGAAEPVVLELDDAFCPWNSGRYRLAGGTVERTLAGADLALDAAALGALYLGGFPPSQLAAAGRIHERAPGALARADVLFRGERAPWCPDIF